MLRVSGNFMLNYFLSIFALLTLNSCNNSGVQTKSSIADTPKKVDIPFDKKVKENFETTEIDCDTVYFGKGYKLKLTKFDSINEDETKFNTVFSFQKRSNGQFSEIFRDSIFNKVQDVKFEDYNNDKIRDILIQNYSDVRSNWTYYLYLIDTTNDRLKKINGFEEIKNPSYVSKYDLIDNYVVSGTNWTSFYKIKGDTILDFGIVIYADPSVDNDLKYDRNYKKAIKTILAREKNNR